MLQRAAAALRAAHDGQREGSGFTRARILASVASRRRPWLRRWLVLAPLGSALLVGSAWAQSTGSWPRVWQAVATVLPFIEATPREQPDSPKPPQRRPELPVAPPPEPLVEPPPAVPPPAVPPPAVPPPAVPPPAAPPSAMPPPAGEPAASPALAERAPSTAPPSRPSRARRVAPSPAPEPAPDPELRRFRAAHELHVQGHPRAAIDAYQDYLQAYPNGRFVPEARYNSALDAIKLGELGAARRLLEPFAAGAYGGYRRSEAQRLLDALSATEPR